MPPKRKNNSNSNTTKDDLNQAITKRLGSKIQQLIESISQNDELITASSITKSGSDTPIYNPECITENARITHEMITSWLKINTIYKTTLQDTVNDFLNTQNKKYINTRGLAIVETACSLMHCLLVRPPRADSYNTRINYYDFAIALNTNAQLILSTISFQSCCELQFENIWHRNQRIGLAAKAWRTGSQIQQTLIHLNSLPPGSSHLQENITIISESFTEFERLLQIIREQGEVPKPTSDDVQVDSYTPRHIHLARALSDLSAKISTSLIHKLQTDQHEQGIHQSDVIIYKAAISLSTKTLKSLQAVMLPTLSQHQTDAIQPIYLCELNHQKLHFLYNEGLKDLQNILALIQAKEEELQINNPDWLTQDAEEYDHKSHSSATSDTIELSTLQETSSTDRKRAEALYSDFKTIFTLQKIQHTPITEIFSEMQDLFNERSSKSACDPQLYNILYNHTVAECYQFLARKICYTDSVSCLKHAATHLNKARESFLQYDPSKTSETETIIQSINITTQENIDLHESIKTQINKTKAKLDQEWEKRSKKIAKANERHAQENAERRARGESEIRYPENPLTTALKTLTQNHTNLEQQNINNLNEQIVKRDEWKQAISSMQKHITPQEPVAPARAASIQTQIAPTPPQHSLHH